MDAMEAATETKKGTFPRSAVELALRDELTTAAATEAALHGNSLPATPAEAVLAPVSIDSLTVVEVVCAVEPVLGFKPSNATVRPGGYNSIQDAMNHLMSRLERQWRKHKGVPA